MLRPALYLVLFLSAIALEMAGCSPDKIFARPYPARWPALKVSSDTTECAVISGIYDVTGEVGYPEDTEQERTIPFEGLVERTIPTGYRDHVRLTHDPKAGRLEVAIEGEHLRWPEEPGAPGRQKLVVSKRVECLDGWVVFPPWISTGEGGNGESGVTKGWTMIRLSLAQDGSLIVRNDGDSETTFFPLIDVKHVRGTLWFRFRPVK